MPRYKLTIAYDGTEFCGWQKQEPLAAVAGGTPPAASGEVVGSGGPRTPAYSVSTPMMETEREGRVALRTVQGVVEQVLRGVCRERIELIGASRTDSGVHAKGQVAAFSSIPDGKGMGWPADRGLDRLKAAVNSRLPNDVSVLSAEEVPIGFNPIGDAVRKRYSYTFCVGPVKPIWLLRTVNWVARGQMDVARMVDAGQTLVGEHDFAAFAAAGHGRLTTVRTIYSLTVRELEAPDPGNRIVRMEVEGNGFLWNMVRIIAGTLMQVGLNQKPVESVQEALHSRDRQQAGITALPQGLCLERIWYADPV